MNYLEELAQRTVRERKQREEAKRAAQRVEHDMVFLQVYVPPNVCRDIEVMIKSIGI